MLRLELCCLDAHLAVAPPAFASFRRDCLVELLHQLTVVPAKNRKLARYLADEPRGYVPLNAQVLRRWLPDNRAYLDYALGSGLLECDDHYRPGDKSRGYRYAAPYRRDGPQAYFQPRRLQDVDLLARLRTLQTATPTFDWAVQARKDYASVLDCLHPRRCPLRLHTAAALAFITAERDQAGQDPSRREVRPKRWSKKAKKAKRKNQPKNRSKKLRSAQTLAVLPDTKDPVEQYRQRFATLAQLDSRDFRYKIDTYGRLHTVLTRLSSHLRRYVYAEGQAPLVAIDLRNSQPYLVNILLQATWYDAPWRKGRRGAHPPLTLSQEGRNLAQEAAEETSKQPPNAQIASANISSEHKRMRRKRRAGQQGTHPGQAATDFYVMRCRQLLGINSLGFAQFRADVEHFGRLTSSGTFYEQMQVLLGPALGKDKVSREQVKQMLFEVLFSRNVVETEAKAAFTQLFPIVDAVLRVYKRRDYRYLAQLLQTLESHLFLRRLVPLVRKRWPDIQVFSVHDSLIVPADYADRVETLMQQQLTRWVGLPPQFKREHWGGEMLPAPPG